MGPRLLTAVGLPRPVRDPTGWETGRSRRAIPSSLTPAARSRSRSSRPTSSPLSLIAAAGLKIAPTLGADGGARPAPRRAAGRAAGWAAGQPRWGSCCTDCEPNPPGATAPKAGITHHAAQVAVRGGSATSPIAPVAHARRPSETTRANGPPSDGPGASSRRERRRWKPCAACAGESPMWSTGNSSPMPSKPASRPTRRPREGNGGDYRLQRGRPNPHSRTFGTATARTRSGHATRRPGLS
jgi:hypothetical protein